MTPPDTSPEPGQHAQTIRGLVWNALIDGLGSYIVYFVVHRHSTEFRAIVWSMLPPAVNNLWTLARKRHLDMFGVLVIAGLLAGLGLVLLGGSPRLLLVRDSLITGVIGVALLASLLFPRPLLFYVLRQLARAGDPEMAATLDEDYARSQTKFGLPLITGVWGATLASEAVLRTALALSLPIPLFMIVSPIMNLTVYAAVSAWSYFYGQRMRDKEDQFMESQATTEVQVMRGEDC